MSTYFTIWHYLAVLLMILLFALGVVVALRQEEKKIIKPMIFSMFLILTLIGIFSVVALDKYTKEVSLSNVENHRILSIEKIVYTGVVKNVGNYTIGTVSFEVKLVNRGSKTGNLKAGSFYKPSGFLDFFGGGANVLYQPQTITKKFVVATNLKPNRSQDFRVLFDYPPYFEQPSEFTTLRAH